MASCAKITFSFPNRVLSERTFLLPFQQDDLFADTEEVYVSNTGDEDLLLEAENFFDKEVKQTKDSFLLLKPGDKFLISSSQYPNLYYLPGTYELKTSTLDKVSSFSVVTNIKDEQNLVELVSALERFQKHLTINFSRVENDYLLRLKRILNEYDLKIQKAISRIERNPDKIICKKYYLSQSKAVQDYKTERLNNRFSSRKGYYSVKKVLSYDTGYNRRLKHSLRDIIISMKKYTISQEVLDEANKVSTLQSELLNLSSSNVNEVASRLKNLNLYQFLRNVFITAEYRPFEIPHLVSLCSKVSNLKPLILQTLSNPRILNLEQMYFISKCRDA